MSRSTRDPAERAVAVIGVGAILPDALDAKAFWQNVVTGRDSISEVTLDRWDPADYYDPDAKAPGKTYSKIGGWVRGVSFEPTKFRIPPTVSAAMDDGQKWALLCAAEALRDAGHPDRPLDTESTAVILGNAMGGELHYLTCLRLSMPEYVHAISDTQVFQSLALGRPRGFAGAVAGIGGPAISGHHRRHHARRVDQHHLRPRGGGAQSARTEFHRGRRLRFFAGRLAGRGRRPHRSPLRRGCYRRHGPQHGRHHLHQVLQDRRAFPRRLTAL